jgi:hemerythrin
VRRSATGEGEDPMAFFEWKDEYSSGIAGIDDQHKVIVRQMNELFEAIRYERDEAVIKGVFVELLRYAHYHFELEAELFTKHEYADKARHVKEHEHFIDKVKSLMVSGYLTDRNIPVETLQYLKSWFQDHMMKTDMEYCRFFNFKEVMDEVEAFIESQVYR